MATTTFHSVIIVLLLYAYIIAKVQHFKWPVNDHILCWYYSNA